VTSAMGQRVWTYIIVGLFAIGLVFTLLRNPLSVLIPLVILGVIIYFLRRPRQRLFRPGTSSGPWRSGNPYVVQKRPADKPFGLKLKADVPSIPERQKRKAKKKHAFRVIEGKKGKMPPSDKNDDKHLLH